jgi:hypothetical protein
MRFTLLILLFLILFVLPISAFSVGFSSFGMNHTLANNLLQDGNEWCLRCFQDIDIIVFSNSQCVGFWGGYCNQAKFEFKGSYSRITLGNMNTLSYDDLLFLLKHELVHNMQYLAKPDRSGFSSDEEEIADNIASSSVFINP